MVELLAFIALFDGEWRSCLLYSIVKKVHVKALMEKASSLVWVGELDLDESGWLLSGFACYSVYSGDVDALFVQFFFDLCLCDVCVNTFDDQQFCRGFRWGHRAVFAC